PDWNSGLAEEPVSAGLYPLCGARGEWEERTLSALLEVRDATKRFGGVIANNRINLTVGEGRIVGLIGPNGSGKTTLFNSIAGSHRIDSGSIRFDGQEISNLRTVKIARLGLLRTYQQTRTFRQMSCLDNMLISVP